MEFKYAWSGQHLLSISTATGLAKFQLFTVGHMITANRVMKKDFIPQTIPFSETMSSNLPHDFEDNPAGFEAV